MSDTDTFGLYRAVRFVRHDVFPGFLGLRSELHFTVMQAWRLAGYDVFAGIVILLSSHSLSVKSVARNEGSPG